MSSVGVPARGPAGARVGMWPTFPNQEGTASKVSRTRRVHILGVRVQDFRDLSGVSAELEVLFEGIRHASSAPVSPAKAAHTRCVPPLLSS